MSLCNSLTTARKRRRLSVCAIAALAILLAGGSARASDPQAYTVNLPQTGEGPLDAALDASLLLESLRTKSPAGPFALVGRAKGDVERLQTALRSFGYYQATVTVRIAGRALSDPDLIVALDKVPEGTSVAVQIAIDKGPLYRLRNIRIDGAMPAGVDTRLGIRTGRAAIATDILAAQSRLLNALREAGFAMASVDAPIADVDDAAHVLDIVLKADAGPKVNIGPISIKGLKDAHESIVHTALTIHQGQLYQPSKIEEARQAILALGIFSEVEVRESDRPDSQGGIPLTFDVREKPLHAVALTAAYSTDLGGSASATWTHRNLFGNAEQLNLSVAATGLGGSATNSLGYNLTAQLLKPLYPEKDQTLEFDLGAIKQDLIAYQQKAITAGVFLRQKFSASWNGSVGLTAVEEDIAQEGVSRSYQLMGLPVTANFDSTGLSDHLQDPTHGARAQFSVTPTAAFNRSATYVSLQATASTYFDLADLGLAKPGRSVLALRALAGSIQGASQFDLPPDQRLYAGGSGTVRGFKYQSLGPLFPDDNPIGATAVDAATIEFRQRFLRDFGAAVFVDAGQVSATSAPFEGTPRVGAGTGIRYYTPIGPVRFDIAVPVNRAPGGDAFEIYIGLGQAF